MQVDQRTIWRKYAICNCLRYVVFIILCVIGLRDRPIGVCAVIMRRQTPSSEYVVSPYSCYCCYWSAAAAAAAGWHLPDHIISAISTFPMALCFWCGWSSGGHVMIIIGWWQSGGFMVGVWLVSGRLIFCKLVLGTSEYNPCVFTCKSWAEY